MEVRAYASSSLSIPGKSNPGEGCGEWAPLEFCEACGEPHMGEQRCEQRQCPECWTKWRKNQAMPIVRRLAAARESAGEGLEKRAVHAVVSPPEGEVTTLVEFDDMMRRAYDLLDEAGVRGGVAIPHGWRVTDEAKREWARETDGGDDGPSLWAWVRESGDWRTCTYWSPHVHVLGLSREFEAPKPEAVDDWIVSRIRTFSNHRLTNPDCYEDLARASMYLMSHSAFEPQSGKDSIRWFGDLHPSRFSPDPRDGDDPELPALRRGGWGVDPRDPVGSLQVYDLGLAQLSLGTYKIVSRKAAEAVEVPNPEDPEGPEDPEKQCSPCTNCEARCKSPIHEAPEALQDREWCEQIGREQQRRLKAAFKWLLGEVVPPPGLKRPGTLEEARESFEAVAEQLG
jgi:hypothetical protein